MTSPAASDPNNASGFGEELLVDNQLQGVWAAEIDDWKSGLHDTIEACRDAMRGVSLFEIPDEFDLPNKDDLTVSLPQKQTVPMQMVALMGARRPTASRNASGSTHTPVAREIATNVSTWANATARKVIDWRKMVEVPYLDGAGAVTIVPSMGHWQRIPDYLDTVTRQKLDRLPSRVRAQYVESDPETEGGDPRYQRQDESGRVLPKPTYQRDSKGRRRDDPYYSKRQKNGARRKFKLDRSASRRAYEKVRSEYLAIHPPFYCRILSPTEAIPKFGPDEQLEGLITREEFTEDRLHARGFRWGKGPALLQRTGKGPVTLYTYWYYDEDRVPHVKYEVEGSTQTWIKDGAARADAIINLAEECGFRDLPAHWYWGLNLRSNDYTTRAVPFLAPTIRSLTTAEAFLTFKAIHAYKHAFVSWAIEANPEVARVRPELIIQKSGQPRSIEIKPNTAFITPGPMKALVPPHTGPDVDTIVKTLLQEVESNSPSKLAMGMGAATSGHDRSLARDYLETAMDQVLSSALEAYKFVISKMIEAACFISDEYDVYVPIYANVKVPQDKSVPNGRKTQSTQIVELNPSWVGEIFDIECSYPKQGLDDVAMITILAQLYKEGLLTFYEFRERALGDEAPEDSQIALWIDQNLRTPQGREVIAQRTQDKYGAAIEKEKQRLIERGLLSATGTPLVSLLPPSKPRPPGPPMGPGGPLPPMGPGGPPVGPSPIPGPPGAPPPPPGPIPGDPNNSQMPGSPLGNFANMQAVGGIVAGDTERASTNRDSLARATQGVGIGNTKVA